MDYKDTLLMPKTDFEMRGNLPTKEPGILERWEKDDHYNQILKAHEGEPLYVLHDGPPYANGNLHAGTGMNRVIKDIINRSHAMHGFYTPFFPGWDTHGLPIENAIQKLGVNRKEMPVADFRKKCEEYAYEQIEIQKSTMKRLGTIADFDHPYITLKKEFESRQIDAFAKMALDGLIYQGLKPIYWSPAAETAIADSEIVYIDKKDPTIYVAFDVLDGKGVLEGDERFVIWTTTPWTIPANLAICLNEAFDYAVVQTEKGKLIFLENKVDELLAKFGLTNQGILKTFKGKELEYITVKHPFYPERPSLIILGNHVTDEDGTGAVHTAPGHGADDFYVGMKYGLKAYCPVDEKGCMMKEAGDFLEGLFVDDANKVVGQKLDELGNLIHLEFVTHSYPHDERLKRPIIFRATVQWFASIDKIREKLLEQIKSVRWENEWGEVRLFNMIKDRGDWCISRQRLWGLPIPIIYNEDDSPIMEKEVFEHISKLIYEKGSNVWFESDVKDLLPEGYTNPKSPNGNFRKEKDIMDVWFDSGSSHNELEARGLPYPADLYFEGSDQYRGWFNSSLIIGTAIHGQAPYKNVLSHGYVCDSKGEKMSKSIGNVVNPMDVINKLGADIFRLWATTVDFKQDMRIGDENLKQVSEQYRKVRNTFKFMLGNVNAEDFDPKKDRVSYEDLTPVDQYIEVLLNDVLKAVRDNYMKFDFLAAAGALMNLMTNELSSYYLDFTKDILYIEKKDSLRRRQVQTVIWDAIDTLAKCWAPSLVYTMDEVWSMFSNDEADSVHYTHFPEVKHFDNAEVLKDTFAKMHEIRDEALKALELARADKVIGKPLEAELTIECSKEDQDLLETTLNGKVAQWLIVSKVTFVNKAERKITVTPAKGTVCPRCWNITEDHEEDGLCVRCQHVLND
ncbi:isoleucine--tRNA ligase [Anaerorhabdus furcosa]|uniref:Isoleucine--tRNA ligase n=1 Tax=Anaerorhabdus furcosa TaxID=118967 RepID=A0A1T4PSX6_9FIRM|nr:isoleucine--tRNA ligase [Anaerorhabdus furcosa]SJZ94744.1 Isoleucyl-tRNA synthetase [Anaerorhabdus furcosa]